MMMAPADAQERLRARARAPPIDIEPAFAADGGGCEEKN